MSKKGERQLQTVCNFFLFLKMMKTVGIKAYKAAEEDSCPLSVYEVPKPKATGRDLLIKVKAVATNPIDYKKLNNFGDTSAIIPEDQAPLTVGWDAAGVVEQVGEDTSLFQVGDEVYFAGDWLRPGAFADYTVVDERIVGKKPSSLTFSQAASLPLTGITAWEAMVDKLQVSQDPHENTGKVILIVGGAGGVSSAAVNLGKALGLSVIATGSRPESKAYVTEMGADHVIDHRKSLTEQVHALGFKEVDYVFHTQNLSSELVSEFVGLLKPYGGLASTWPSATVDLMSFFFKGITFAPVLMFIRPPLKNRETEKQHAILNAMSALVDEGKMVHRETTNSKFTLDNLRKSLKMQASGKTIGKITLTM